MQQQRKLRGFVKADNSYSYIPQTKSKYSKLNNSVDVAPINRQLNNPKSLSQRTLSPIPARNRIKANIKEVKPVLGVNLKIEVAKANPKNRATLLETAYVLEEMLISVEQGLSSLPEREHLVKQKIINKVLQDRLARDKEELRKREEQQARINRRKEMLKQEIERSRQTKSEKQKDEEEKR